MNITKESERSDLAKIPVKNHYYGTLNPKAHMQKIVTEEQAMSGLVVAYPLRLHDCSLISDGAASVIMVSEKLAARFDKPVWLTGLGAGSETHDIGRRKSLTSLESACVAAEQAYKMAGISPRDVDVAVVHAQFDCSQYLSQKMDWFECPAEGNRVTFTQVMVLPEYFALSQPSIPFSKAVLTPSPVGVVEVKEGIRIMGWIPKTMAGDLKVGDRMKASPQTLDDGRVTITFEKLE